MSVQHSIPEQAPEQATMSSDWRVKLFGPYIQLNQSDVETPADEYSDVDITNTNNNKQELVSTSEALDSTKYDYIALFLGADYCPHCKAFAPTVKQAKDLLQDDRKCKVLFMSNDRTKEAFEASCQKNLGIDVVPYDLDKTRNVRDLFDLKTIPALMILKNKDFDKTTPTVVTNAREALVADPDAKFFPWVSDEPMSFMDRLLIRGGYGKWWELGHHVNPDFPDQVYMDEHAVRARAGLLNIVTWVAIINVFEWRDPNLVLILFPLVAYEFLTSLIVGLTPISPFGVVGTIMAIIFHPEPLWKPAKPKRFAWAIGLFLSTMCFVFVSIRDYLGGAYLPLVRLTVILCNIATWFESSNGFCFGCFIYNTVLVPVYKLEECSECKL